MTSLPSFIPGSSSTVTYLRNDMRELFTRPRLETRNSSRSCNSGYRSGGKGVEEDKPAQEVGGSWTGEGWRGWPDSSRREGAMEQSLNSEASDIDRASEKCYFVSVWKFGGDGVPS